MGDPPDLPDASAPEVPIFARAFLVAHQLDAIPYLDMRVAQFVQAGEDADAAFWSAVRGDAQRQINSGEWRPAGLA